VREDKSSLGLEEKVLFTSLIFRFISENAYNTDCHFELFELGEVIYNVWCPEISQPPKLMPLRFVIWHLYCVAVVAGDSALILGRKHYRRCFLRRHRRRLRTSANCRRTASKQVSYRSSVIYYVYTLNSSTSPPHRTARPDDDVPSATSPGITRCRRIFHTTPDLPHALCRPYVAARSLADNRDRLGTSCDHGNGTTKEPCRKRSLVGSFATT